MDERLARHAYGASGYVDPLTPSEQRQRDAALLTGYGPIWLRREGEHVIVEVSLKGEWVPVIKEHIDGNFSHCVEPIGIDEEFQRRESKR